MRVLFISNFFPPFSFGGMEISCESVVRGLADRGHKTLVLTSTNGVTGASDDVHVVRKLRLQMDLRSATNIWSTLRYQTVISENLTTLRTTIARFDPDVAFIWGMWDLDHQIAYAAEELMSGRVLYRMADYWPALSSQRVGYWDEPGSSTIVELAKKTARPLAKAILRREPKAFPTFPYGFCVSRALREELIGLGFPADHMPVVHTGFELGQLTKIDLGKKWETCNPTDLLFAGRLSPEKGIEQLVKALASLVREDPVQGWKLTIAGEGKSSYEQYLNNLAERLGIWNRIVFLGQISQIEIARLLNIRGVVIVPSVWSDPLPRIAIEAMAAGCVVVASDAGGLPEIVEHGRSGILFKADDIRSMSKALQSLPENRDVALSMGQAARKRALHEFSFEPMIENVEILLHKVRQSREFDRSTFQERPEMAEIMPKALAE